jgi:hypothetical protein
MEPVSSSKNNRKYLLIKIMSYPIRLKSSSTLQWGLQILHISTCPPWHFTHHKQTNGFIEFSVIQQDRNSSTAKSLSHRCRFPAIMVRFLWFWKITHIHNELLHQTYCSSKCHFPMSVIQNTQSWLLNRAVWTWNWHCFVSNTRFQQNNYKLQIYLDKSDFHAPMNVTLYYKI